MKRFNAVLSLRRDNDYNYAKIKDTFVPANGEICLVDTAAGGLRAVCGDGLTPFGALEFIDQLILKGYYFDNIFYKDKNKTQTYNTLINKIYIDIPSNSIYYYDGEFYQKVSGGLPTATATTAGIMKLYTTLGQNEDGTMTQKAITDELNEKVEIALNIDEEILIFEYD